jgi:hypothetical protein
MRWHVTLKSGEVIGMNKTNVGNRSINQSISLKVDPLMLEIFNYLVAEGIYESRNDAILEGINDEFDFHKDIIIGS